MNIRFDVEDAAVDRISDRTESDGRWEVAGGWDRIFGIGVFAATGSKPDVADVSPALKGSSEKEAFSF